MLDIFEGPLIFNHKCRARLQLATRLTIGSIICIVLMTVFITIRTDLDRYLKLSSIFQLMCSFAKKGSHQKMQIHLFLVRVTFYMEKNSSKGSQAFLTVG